jgi:putative addiction module component (TIGR02574 family)
MLVPMSSEALAEVLRLPRAERIELVQAVWDSIVAEAGVVPVTAEQRAEPERRLAALAAEPEAERSWPQVLASLERPR